MQMVRVVNEHEGWLGTEYYINGQKIPNVRAVDFRVAVDEIPKFTFETMGLPDIDMRGDVRFSFTPVTVVEAIKVMRHELMNDRELYSGFLACIESALRSQLPFEDEAHMAKRVLDQLIGEERDGEE